jgi:CheY-like chemotaxis protein
MLIYETLKNFITFLFIYFVAVKTCTKVSDALNLLNKEKDSFDVVVIEAQMPDMDSCDFLQHVIQQFNIPVISKYNSIIICVITSHD